jgi:hypothetical protein
MRRPDVKLTSQLLVGGAILAALVLVGTSRPAHRAGPVSPVQGQRVYSDGADREPVERQDASRRFRDSPWSQDDDFHSKEMKRVKEYAKVHDVSISSLLDALDDGMHQDWPTKARTPPNPKVMPCRPRLMY